MKVKVIIFIVLLLSSFKVTSQPVGEDAFCQSNADCKTSCCYNLKCMSRNTCDIMRFVSVQEKKLSCVIDDQCSESTGCCLNKTC